MKKPNDRILTLIYILGVSLMLILRDLQGVAISKFIIMAFSLAVLAMAQYETMVQMLSFTLPLVCGLPGTYLMLGALLLLIVKRKRINFWQLGSIAFIVIAEVVASLWYPRLDVIAIVNYISFAGIVFFLIHDSEELDFQECIQRYLYGTALLLAVIVISTLQTAPRNWLDSFARGMFRFGQEHVGNEQEMVLLLNANSMAYYSVVGMACGVFLAERKKGFWRIFNIAAVVFFAVAGFLTLSRSWLLVVAICMLLYIFSKLRSPKQFLAVALVLVVVFTVGSIYLQQHPELTAGFLARLTDDTVETGGGRENLFIDYMEAFFAQVRFILMGTGVTQYHSQTQIYESMHNGTQQILVCYGIIGFIVFMTSLIRSVVSAKGTKGKKRDVVRYLPLIAVVLFVQTIQFLNPNMLMLPFIIGVYAVKAGRQSNEDLSYYSGHRGGQPLEVETR